MKNLKALGFMFEFYDHLIIGQSTIRLRIIKILESISHQLIKNEQAYHIARISL